MQFEDDHQLEVGNLAVEEIGFLYKLTDCSEVADKLVDDFDLLMILLFVIVSMVSLALDIMKYFFDFGSKLLFTQVGT